MPSTDQNNQIQEFYSEEFGHLEVLLIDSKPYFPAVECAAILGYRKPHNAVSRHCGASLKRGVIDALDRIQEKLFIPEGDLYRLILRSNLPSATRFEAFVCDTVLPSIRKYGAYIMPGTLEEMIQNPEFTAALLEELQKERAKNAELTPKASYYDKILMCKQAIPISLVAKDYGLSAARFNKLLHEYGLQYRIAGTWLLYQEYASQGYTQTRTYYFSENKATIHTCWTMKGRIFLYDFLLAQGIEPLANCLDDMEDYIYEEYEQVYMEEIGAGA